MYQEVGSFSGTAQILGMPETLGLTFEEMLLEGAPTEYVEPPCEQYSTFILRGWPDQAPAILVP
jgi:hypothetical protein